MIIKEKKAFTMIELIFAIVIIGILASISIPKLAATRDDAVITKARTTIASVRNALSMERQKRILRGDFRKITAVGGSDNVFGNFDNNSSLPSVLEYPVPSEPDKHGRWFFSKGTGKDGRDQYVFNSTLGKVYFEVVNGKFECDASLTNNTNKEGCNQLTR
jgi:general secretion pathway protein G